MNWRGRRLSCRSTSVGQPGSDVSALPQPVIASTDRADSLNAPPPLPPNPDEADQTGEPVIEPVIRAEDARTGAWLALVQAMFGSAEFRYIR